MWRVLLRCQRRLVLHVLHVLHEGILTSARRATRRALADTVRILSVDNTHVMRTAEGNLGIGPGNSARFLFLPDGDGVLAVVLLAPTGRMEEAVRMTEAIWGSIQIGE